MPNFQKRFVEAEVRTQIPEEGVFEAVVSSGKADRMGDVINPDGWELKNYKKNPVILWAHQSGGFLSVAVPPVAKADKVWVEDKELKIKGTWAPTPFAQQLRQLVEGGFLSALSVGFQPLEEPQDSKEGGMKFNKQELLEISWVPVPALPTALVEARKMSLDLVVKALEEKEKENGKANPNDTGSALPDLDKDKDEKLDRIGKKLIEMEEAISALKDIKTPEKGSASEDLNKGCVKREQKSKIEKLLIMFQKQTEILLKESRKANEK